MDEDEDANKQDRDPILICDNIMMTNYFLKGTENATEIEKFEEI